MNQRMRMMEGICVCPCVCVCVCVCVFVCVHVRSLVDARVAAALNENGTQINILNWPSKNGRERSVCVNVYVCECVCV